MYYYDNIMKMKELWRTRFANVQRFRTKLIGTDEETLSLSEKRFQLTLNFNERAACSRVPPRRLGSPPPRRRSSGLRNGRRGGVYG